MSNGLKPQTKEDNARRPATKSDERPAQTEVNVNVDAKPSTPEPAKSDE